MEAVRRPGYVRALVVREEAEAFFAARVKGRCAWCGGPLAGRRRTWCSDVCHTYGWAHFNPGLFRDLVMDRDGHHCQWLDCGVLDFYRSPLWSSRILLSGCTWNNRQNLDYGDDNYCHSYCGQTSRFLPPRCKLDAESQAILSDELRLHEVARREFVLAVHHIRPVFAGGKYFDVRNAVTLCKTHHMEAHKRFNASARAQCTLLDVDFPVKVRPMRFRPGRNSRRDV